MAMTIDQVEEARCRTLALLMKAGIILTPAEQETIGVYDFGLNYAACMGVQSVTYVNDPHFSARELVLFPHQICPEHSHHGGREGTGGRQETLRCRWGIVYLYVEGEPTPNPYGMPPDDRRAFTARHQVVLRPGQQYTVAPDTRHWLQAGAQGAVVTELSSGHGGTVYTDPRVVG